MLTTLILNYIHYTLKDSTKSYCSKLSSSFSPRLFKTGLAILMGELLLFMSPKIFLHCSYCFCFCILSFPFLLWQSNPRIAFDNFHQIFRKNCWVLFIFRWVSIVLLSSLCFDYCSQTGFPAVENISSKIAFYSLS